MITVGKRTLVAKTCLKCGMLSSDFRRLPRGYYHSWCRTCMNADNLDRAHRLGYYQKESRGPRGRQLLERSVAANRKLQSDSLPNATKHRQPYTLPEWDILLREDLTMSQKAKLLHRTYSAINNQLYKYRTGEITVPRRLL